jgi:hypothetical protein
MKKDFLYLFIILFVVILAGFCFICWDIGKDVKSIAEEASQKYPGDIVDALIAFVDSDDNSTRQRNRAVWALGQLGQKKALPVLERYYHGNPDDRTREISQYELKKAIKLCKGGLNVTAWTWRWYVHRGH